MGLLRTELKNIFSKALHTGPVNRIIDGIVDVFAPITKELQQLEVNHRLPYSIGVHEAPAVSVISTFVQTFGKVAMYTLPFSVRKRFRDVYSDAYDGILRDSDGKTFPDTGEIVPWDSEVACFLRFSVWNAQAVAAGALTDNEIRIELLEKDLEESNDRLKDILAQMNEEPYQPVPDRPAAQSPTQAAVKNLLAGFEDQAQELARKPYEYLIAQLRDEGLISDSIEGLWQEQLDRIRDAFEHASFLTIGAIHRKTGLSRDAIEPLVQGRASTKVHVNTVVRVAGVLGVPLVGITGVEPVAAAPQQEEPTVSRRHRRGRLH